MRHLFIATLLLILLTCNTPTGLAENDATMSPEAIAKKIQVVNANPPAEIIALAPQGTKLASRTFGPDYGSHAYVRIEFLAELPNQNYRLHDRAYLNLQCNLIDPNSILAAMFINAYQTEQEEHSNALRSQLKSATSPDKSWSEAVNQSGKEFSQTVRYVEIGELGKNEKPRVEYYLNCTYLGRVGNAFFEFNINSLPLESKDQAVQWFNELIAKLARLEAVKLCNY